MLSYGELTRRVAQVRERFLRANLEKPYFEGGPGSRALFCELTWENLTSRVAQVHERFLRVNLGKLYFEGGPGSRAFFAS